MDKFNLTFNGEIVDGFDLPKVKKRFAEALLIDDPERVEQFFSDKAVTIRRNLDKDAATAFYTKMYRVGVVLKLEPARSSPTGETSEPRIQQEFREERPGTVDQSWPIRSSSPKTKKTPAPPISKPGNAVRQAEEEKRKREAEALEAKRKAAEEAFKQEEAAALAIKTKAAEEDARVRAEEQRKREEETAKRKAEVLAAKKKAAAEEKRQRDEEAARVKAEKKRLKAEEAAKRKAEALAAKKKAAEEAARARAEEKRKRDEETARLKAEQKRLRTEEAAKRKAEALAAKKKAAAEAARARAEEKHKREEAAAKEEAEEQTRIAAEKERMLAQEIAREEAEKAARREQTAALNAKKKADEEVAIQAALDEIARKKAEEETAAQQALDLAAHKRVKEEEARLRTELTAQKRKHAEAAARAKADEERIEDALRTLAAKSKAEETKRNLSLKEDKQRQFELEEAQRKQQRLAQEKAAKQRAQEREMEKAALQRAAAGTARLEKLQQAAEVTPEPAAKTLKQPAPPTSAIPAALAGSKRQPGAPNLFNLKPFRNTVEIRQRAAASLQLMKVMYIASVVALLTLLILGARYALLPTPDAGITHADKIIANQHSSLFIAAGSELFALDRSGTDSKRYRFADLGLDTGATLLDFDRSGKLLFQSPLAAETSKASSAQRLLRCDLQLTSCAAFAADIPNGKVSDWITDVRTGDSFVAIAGTNSLSRLAQDGSLISQQTVTMAGPVKLAFHEGLLYINSSTGPAIGVFRPDAKGFGEQLDDILLLPPQAQEQGHTRVSNFLWSADSWWVVMTNPETDNGAVYRFDANWEYLSTLAMAPQSLPQQLLAWSGKILVVDSTSVDILRFNAEGETELALTPKALAGDINRKQASQTQSRRLWYASLGLLALLGIVAYVLGRLHQVRALVYKADNVRGAEPIDHKIKSIRWIPLDPKKKTTFKQLVALLAATAILVIGTLAYQLAPINVVVAAIIFFSGPAIGLTLIAMSKPGHVGVLDERLVLVDHNNNYHIDGGARIHYRNNFLLLDDIAVYVGNRLLPVFSTEQLAQSIAPLARAGVKVDRKTVLVKLGQSSHPLTRGMIACAASLGGALFCLLLY